MTWHIQKKKTLKKACLILRSYRKPGQRQAAICRRQAQTHGGALISSVSRNHLDASLIPKVTKLRHLASATLTVCTPIYILHRGVHPAAKIVDRELFCPPAQVSSPTKMSNQNHVRSCPVSSQSGGTDFNLGSLRATEMLRWFRSTQNDPGDSSVA